MFNLIMRRRHLLQSPSMTLCGHELASSEQRFYERHIENLHRWVDCKRCVAVKENGRLVYNTKSIAYKNLMKIKSHDTVPT